MRILLDTNVIVSAILFGGNPRTVLQLVIHKDHTAITSPILMAELSDVLRKKFGYSKEGIDVLARQMKKNFTLVMPTIVIKKLDDDPDNRVLEAALEGKCAYVVTGDTDLLQLHEYRGIRICTPDEFLRMTDN